MTAGGAQRTLVVLVGLTGVGKSTAVDALLAGLPRARLLPNRRELADRIVLPEAQRADGEAVAPVSDRLERFRLTARYRRAHPGGMAHALERYLAGTESAEPGTVGPGAGEPAPLLFDNLRGADEVGYAVGAFSRARFVALEAPVATRILRLAGRDDAFDHVAEATVDASQALLERLATVTGLAGLTDLEALAQRAAPLDPDAVITAARVVAEESLHYDPDAAWARLAPLPAARRLRVDSGRLDRAAVAAAITEWL